MNSLSLDTPSTPYMCLLYSSNSLANIGFQIFVKSWQQIGWLNKEPEYFREAWLFIIISSLGLPNI